MEVISAIIGILSYGAIFVASAIAEEEVQKNYYSLKVFIEEKFGFQRQIAQLEKRPEQQNVQDEIAQDLHNAIMELPQKNAQVIKSELLIKAKSLEKSLATIEKEKYQSIGIDLDNVKVNHLKLGDITSERGSSHIGVRVKNSDIENFEAGDISGKK